MPTGRVSPQFCDSRQLPLRTEVHFSERRLGGAGAPARAVWDPQGFGSHLNLSLMLAENDLKCSHASPAHPTPGKWAFAEVSMPRLGPEAS